MTLLVLAMDALLGVAFDLDGLMFNTEDLYFKTGEELMRRRGRVFTQQLSDAIMGRPPQFCFEEMIRWHGLNEDWQDLGAESEEVYLRMLQGDVAPMPGLMDLLAALEEAEIPKAICTSSNRAVLSAVMDRFELEPRFAFTLTADDITHGKPHPEIYLTAADRFGCEPDQMIALEDSQTGCRAAAASGAVTVAVPAGPSLEHNFDVATLVVESLEDPRLWQLLGLVPS